MKAWVLLALVTVLGCSSGYICHCPQNGCDFSCSAGTAAVPVPLDLPPISGVTATSTCTATYQPDVQRVLVARTGGPGDCDVVIQLADGTSDTAHLHFKAVHAPCACFVSDDNAIFQPTTATP